MLHQFELEERAYRPDLAQDAVWVECDAVSIRVLAQLLANQVGEFSSINGVSGATCAGAVRWCVWAILVKVPSSLET